MQELIKQLKVNFFHGEKQKFQPYILGKVLDIPLYIDILENSGDRVLCKKS